MKTSNIIQFFITMSLSAILFSACKSDKHFSFTESELEWILYNNDNPPRYLVNKTDTITAPINSWMQEDNNCYHEGMPNHYDEYYEDGALDFNLWDSTNITYGAVRIYSYGGFRAEIDIPGRYFDYVAPKEITDTALVNDIIYHGAHEYHVITPDEDDASYFCFVKGKGYVQIILNNGTLIELINE